MNARFTSLHYLFRVACAMCFIGHGAFGIITKPVWCNYFGVFGFSEATSYQLMPVVGIVDIVLGILLLVYPLRGAVMWLIFWGLFTAALRPLSGEPFAEFLERAGNYGAPLALLLLSNGEVTRRPFGKLEPLQFQSEGRTRSIIKSLQVAGFLLLIGHGWLNLLQKASLLKQYAGLGFNNPAQIASIVGWFEVAGAILILVKPVRHVILILAVWKISSELFYPAYPFFEWVERGGSYAVLAGLWVVLKENQFGVLWSKSKLSPTV